VTAPLSPLVLLPGLLCDATLWRAEIEALADVAAVFVPDLTLDDTVAAMAARVLAVAPERFALGALSMGGYVAFEIMRQAPQRVARLALFSTSAEPDTPEEADHRRRGMASLRLGRFVGVGQHLLPQLIHPSRLSDPLAETVRDMAERVGGAAFLKQQEAILSRPDSRPTLVRIAVPTLVAVGDSDVLTPPAEARIIHEGIKGSTLHVLATCGHLPALERPEESTALLRGWLGA
jgi:pimeloyl-ACP methyl ester carboxylesterase